MQQYFVTTKLEIDKEVELSLEQSNHIVKVLRMKSDQVVRLSDQVSIFLARIKVEQKTVVATCFEDVTVKDSFQNKITLFLALLKGDKWDYVLQKVTELGVDQIIPVVTERTIVKIKDNSDRKLERWQKIVLEAAEQSHRLTIPVVREPILMKQMESYKSEFNIVAYELQEDQLIQSLLPKDQSIAVFIGPEGGFSVDEIDYLKKLNFHTCSLGKRILRAETAAIYSMSVMNCLLGEME